MSGLRHTTSHSHFLASPSSTGTLGVPDATHVPDAVSTELGSGSGSGLDLGSGSGLDLRSGSGSGSGLGLGSGSGSGSGLGLGSGSGLGSAPLRTRLHSTISPVHARDAQSGFSLPHASAESLKNSCCLSPGPTQKSTVMQSTGFHFRDGPASLCSTLAKMSPSVAKLYRRSSARPARHNSST